MRSASAALLGAVLALAACQRADDPPAAASRAGGPPAPSDGASDATITGERWRLVAIRRPGAAAESVAPDPRYTVEFGSDGRYFGQAHCNSYTGGYELPIPGQLTIRAGAATLAACPSPSIADEYLRALASVSRYDVRDDELRLTYNSSGELEFVLEAREAAAAPELGRTFVFDCDGDVSFTVRFGPGEMALWAPESLGGTYQVLSVARSGSGARYEEGNTVFWNKGDLATIEIAGQRFVDCRSTPSKAPWADAKRRGATFRALGNEPAWYVEIFPDRLVIVTELGTKRSELPYGAPVVDGARTTYRAAAEGRDATVVIDRRACADSMSGDGFEAAATVSFENRTLRGCGRFL